MSLLTGRRPTPPTSPPPAPSAPPPVADGRRTARWYAPALGGLLRDPDRAASLGAAGREAAEQRWDWGHREGQLMDVIEKSVQPRSRKVVTA